MLDRQKDMEIGDKVVTIKDASRYKSWAGKGSPFNKAGLIREIYRFDNGHDIAIVQIGGPHGHMYTLFLHELELFAEKPLPEKPNNFYYD
jgi:hypothetical protein